jgi:hypothetical protein
MNESQERVDRRKSAVVMYTEGLSKPYDTVDHKQFAKQEAG